MNLQWLTSTLGSTAATVVVIIISALLSKNWIVEFLTNQIKHKFDKDLETHKAQIKNNYDGQFLKLKTALEQEIAISTEKRKADNEHDKLLFAKLTAIANETQIRDVLADIKDCGFFDMPQYKRIKHLNEAMENVENQFLNKSIQESYLTFYQTLDLFTTLVFTYFFAGDSDRYWLYPDLKYSDDDQDRHNYDNARNKLRESTKEVLDAHTAFREIVRNTLSI